MLVVSAFLIKHEILDEGAADSLVGEVVTWGAILVLTLLPLIWKWFEARFNIRAFNLALMTPQPPTAARTEAIGEKAEAEENVIPPA